MTLVESPKIEFEILLENFDFVYNNFFQHQNQNHLVTIHREKAFIYIFLKRFPEALTVINFALELIERNNYLSSKAVTIQS